MLPVLAYGVGQPTIIGINANTAGAIELIYGGQSWRVIGYDGLGVASEANTITLLSKDIIGKTVFSTNDSIAYSESNLRTSVEAICSSFDAREKAAVVPRTLETGTYIGAAPWCDGIAGDPVVTASLWPLSTAEAYKVNMSLLNINKNYWLRSPTNKIKFVSYCTLNGVIDLTGGSITYSIGIRPAMKLDLSTILFTSAEAGKPGAAAATLVKQTTPSPSGVQKLTIIDHNLTSGSVTVDGADSKANTAVTINVSGATANKAVSAIITSSIGALKYYGKIGESDASGNASNLDLTLPVALDSDNILKLFVEEMNGNNLTDYASIPVTVTLHSDAAKLAEAKAAIEEALDNLVYSNATEENDILAAANSATIHGVSVAWDATNAFNKANTTSVLVGSITGALQLSLNSTSETLLINKVIAQLLPADGEASNSSISPTNLSKNRSSRSLYTHAVTGIKAVGKMSSNITVKPIVRMKNGVDDELVDAVTYDELAVTLDKKATILGVYEIKCMSFSENLTLIFPVDAKYNEKEFLVKHKKVTGEIVTYNGRVEDGKIIITVSSLSPFMIAIKDDANINTAAWENPFLDVQKNDWFYESVATMNSLGLMQGTTKNTFEPNLAISRARAISMLYQLASQARVATEDTAWYAKARAWAMEKDISDGTRLEEFISKEQLVTMLWRIAGSPMLADYEGLNSYTDAKDISRYAQQALMWAQQKGIIKGKGNNILAANKSVTRSEIATIIANYLKVTE